MKLHNMQVPSEQIHFDQKRRSHKHDSAKTHPQMLIPSGMSMVFFLVWALLGERLGWQIDLGYGEGPGCPRAGPWVGPWVGRGTQTPPPIACSRDTTSVSQSVLSSVVRHPPALSLIWHANEIIHLRGRVGGKAAGPPSAGMGRVGVVSGHQ